jgi:hypothetical protein
MRARLFSFLVLLRLLFSFYTYIYLYFFEEEETIKFRMIIRGMLRVNGMRNELGGRKIINV